MQETWVRFLGREDPWRRKWQSTPALLPGKSHGQRSLIGYSPWGRRVGHDWATSLSLSKCSSQVRKIGHLTTTRVEVRWCGQGSPASEGRAGVQTQVPFSPPLLSPQLPKVRIGTVSMVHQCQPLSPCSQFHGLKVINGTDTRQKMQHQLTTNQLSSLRRAHQETLILWWTSLKLLSRVRLFEIPQTTAYQASLSMGFSRQEYRSGLPFSSLGDLPDPRIEPRSPVLQADALPSKPPGKLLCNSQVSHCCRGTQVSETVSDS